MKTESIYSPTWLRLPSRCTLAICAMAIDVSYDNLNGKANSEFGRTLRSVKRDLLCQDAFQSALGLPKELPSDIESAALHRRRIKAAGWPAIGLPVLKRSNAKNLDRLRKCARSRHVPHT